LQLFAEEGKEKFRKELGGNRRMRIRWTATRELDGRHQSLRAGVYDSQVPSSRLQPLQPEGRRRWGMLLEEAPKKRVEVCCGLRN
jgi:hypothetical protein